MKMYCAVNPRLLMFLLAVSAVFWACGPEPVPLEHCFDGIDNDADGSLDCDDSDCAAYPTCLRFAEHCFNGIDDDADGLFDCADPECTETFACRRLGEDCVNGRDDDADGAVDCADTKCATIAPCAPGGEWCAGGVDEDGDALIDCDDPDCQGTLLCLGFAERCMGGADEDADGEADCDDPDCQRTSGCMQGGEDCTNGTDDDGDGAADCADADCAQTYACLPLVEECTNGIDDDANGDTDCEDAQCVGQPSCFLGVELCANGIDDDGDALVDCEDSDCAFVFLCLDAPMMSAMEVCDDAAGDDEDGDGASNCDDPDCAMEMSCMVCPDPMAPDCMDPRCAGESACQPCPDPMAPDCMDPRCERTQICLDACGSVFGISCDDFSLTYIKASNPGRDDRFGRMVDIDGDTMIVGAPEEDSSSQAINGDESDDRANNAGAAYVFVRDASGVWTQQAYLKASNAGRDDIFGESVAVSGDTVVVGAALEDGASTMINGDGSSDASRGAGAAYVFVRDASGVWTEQAYLKASNAESQDTFGIGVDIDGDTIVVGASGERSVVVGDETDNMAINVGAAYVFVRSGATWTQQAYLKASNPEENDEFGDAVHIDGDTIVVGAPGEDSGSQDEADNSESGAGAAYVFVRSGATWTQQAYLKASNAGDRDMFGTRVGVSGDTVVVGAWGERSAAQTIDGDGMDDTAERAGAAYVFVRDASGSWTQQAYLKAANAEAQDAFGFDVAIEDDTIVVGAWLEDSSTQTPDADPMDNMAENSGAGYVFVRDASGVWTQQAYLKASNPEESDFFGFGVAIDGDLLGFGAFFEASGFGTIDMNQGDNSAPGAGAVYVIERSEL